MEEKGEAMNATREEHLFKVSGGTIHYWVFRPIKAIASGKPTLVCLPGLTATHLLFDLLQMEFRGEYPLILWDAPGHGASKDFALDFSITDLAIWLHEILEKEGVGNPILIGQSFGGYVAQCFLERYKEEAAGFVSIDSSSIQRSYYSSPVLWLLKHIRPFYECYPWEVLKKAAAWGAAASVYGQELMHHMIAGYTKKEYCALIAYGYKILGEAVEENASWKWDTHTLLVCGARDRAGFVKGYNILWVKKEKLPFHWISAAGHNSNTDNPSQFHGYLKQFLEKIEKK